MSPAVPLYQKLFPPGSLPQVFSAHKYKYARKPLARIQRRHALRARFLSPFPAKAMPDRLFPSARGSTFQPCRRHFGSRTRFRVQKSIAAGFPPQAALRKTPLPQRKLCQTVPALSRQMPRTFTASPFTGKQNRAAARGKKKALSVRKELPIPHKVLRTPQKIFPVLQKDALCFAESRPDLTEKRPCPAEGALTISQKHRLAGGFAPKKYASMSPGVQLRRRSAPSSAGESAYLAAPCSAKNSFDRKPHVTEMQGSPAFPAVMISTSESPI